jgi:hypothetical protein
VSLKQLSSHALKFENRSLPHYATGWTSRRSIRAMARVRAMAASVGALPTLRVSLTLGASLTPRTSLRPADATLPALLTSAPQLQRTWPGTLTRRKKRWALSTQTRLDLVLTSLQSSLPATSFSAKTTALHLWPRMRLVQSSSTSFSTILSSRVTLSPPLALVSLASNRGSAPFELWQPSGPQVLRISPWQPQQDCKAVAWPVSSRA